MSPFLTRHVSTKSCCIFYCPRTKVFSALSPLLFLFFFLTRCVSPLDLPCAGPHDSFSTDILKGPKLSLPPCLFLFFLFSPFSHSLCWGSYCWIVSACSACQDHWNENSEGMKLMWNLHSQRADVCEQRLLPLTKLPRYPICTGGSIHRIAPSWRQIPLQRDMIKEAFMWAFLLSWFKHGGWGAAFTSTSRPPSMIWPPCAASSFFPTPIF